MIFSTVRTTRSVVEQAMKARVDGEAIRFWGERIGRMVEFRIIPFVASIRGDFCCLRSN